MKVQGWTELWRGECIRIRSAAAAAPVTHPTGRPAPRPARRTGSGVGDARAARATRPIYYCTIDERHEINNVTRRNGTVMAVWGNAQRDRVTREQRAERKPGPGSGCAGWRSCAVPCPGCRLAATRRARAVAGVKHFLSSIYVLRYRASSRALAARPPMACDSAARRCVQVRSASIARWLANVSSVLNSLS